jgi:hypothetical protein
VQFRALFVLSILVTGCGKSKDGDKPSKDTPAGPTSKSKDVASLFTGTSVTLPPEVAKVSFDAKKADVLASVGADSGYLSSKTHADVSYDLQFSRDDKLEQISVRTRGAPLAPILTKQWGEPIKVEKGERFWFNPSAGMRAWLPDYGKGEVVAISRYQPIATLLGPTGFDLAFAKGKPLFGATLDELHAAWGAQLCDWDRKADKLKKDYEDNVKDSIASLEMSALQLRLCTGGSRTVEQFAGLGDTIYMGLDQKAFAIGMSFRTGGSPELAAQIAKELDAKFGAATEVKEGDDTVRYYLDPASKQRAIAKLGKDYVNLTVGPYLPVAELIGDATKPGLAIETPSMIGGTVAQIAAEDAAHIRHQGVLHSLVYPPTEWTFFQTEVRLDLWAKETRTHGYHTVLHHTHNPKAGDDLYALLETKYGKPKKVAGDDKDKTFSFAKGGRKLEARRVSEQWQLTYAK